MVIDCRDGSLKQIHEVSYNKHPRLLCQIYNSPEQGPFPVWEWAAAMGFRYFLQFF